MTTRDELADLLNGYDRADMVLARWRLVPVEQDEPEPNGPRRHGWSGKTVRGWRIGDTTLALTRTQPDRKLMLTLTDHHRGETLAVPLPPEMAEDLADALTAVHHDQDAGLYDECNATDIANCATHGVIPEHPRPCPTCDRANRTH